MQVVYFIVSINWVVDDETNLYSLPSGDNYVILNICPLSTQLL